MTNVEYANSFAYFALAVWPLVVLILYLRLRIGLAILWSILAAQMLLPVGVEIKFAGVPALDKGTIANLGILFGCMLVGREQKPGARLGMAEILMAIYIMSPFVTAFFNQDVVNVTGRVLPPESYYDALSAAVTQYIAIVPFIVARTFLSRFRDLRDIMAVLVMAGLAYSVLLLFEIRMSPQLHYWVYGFSPTDFIQTVREGGGFRPMAFMGHGLTAAFFSMTTVVAAATLWKIEPRAFRLPMSWVATYLGVVLLLCKSAAAIVYAAILIPAIRYATPRLQTKLATLLVFVALLYPLLRTMDLIPTDKIVELANVVSTSRADSMRFRFVNEAGLLERAAERPFFGWGRFGRSRIYDEASGKDMSVTDGRWTITTGQFGLIGFLAEFGLLALGVLRCTSALQFVRTPAEQALLTALALIVSVSIINLLPNGALLGSTWLFAGALLGATERSREKYRIRQKRPRKPLYAPLDSNEPTRDRAPATTFPRSL